MVPVFFRRLVVDLSPLAPFPATRDPIQFSQIAAGDLPSQIKRRYGIAYRPRDGVACGNRLEHVGREFAHVHVRSVLPQLVRRNLGLYTRDLLFARSDPTDFLEKRRLPAPGTSGARAGDTASVLQ